MKITMTTTPATEVTVVGVAAAVVIVPEHEQEIVATEIRREATINRTTDERPGSLGEP